MTESVAPEPGSAGLPTAFVSHADCGRHDTGWRHPEHQGRLPALVRAVYRDMLTLHGHLVEVEATPATEAELLTLHTPAWVERVRRESEQAAVAGQPRTLEGELVVSGASWDAALAGVGAALTGVDAVAAGHAANAFCAARPPGHAALPDGGRGFSLFNSVAIAARQLRVRHGFDRVLVVQWAGTAGSGIREALAGDPGVRMLEIGPAAEPASPRSDGQSARIGLPVASNGALFAAAFEAGLARSLEGWRPDFVLLAAGFDGLAADPLGSLALEPADYHGLTTTLRLVAERHCAGRLVSVLEGGYAPAETGRAVVQHIRGLTRLPPA